MRLLIVEDDAALARAVIKVFRDQGLAVDHVSSGREALEIVKMEPYSAMF
jgi:two-component system OmpR family response regulator